MQCLARVTILVSWYFELTVAQLYFYYSAMNAGKSTSLLQSAHNYREQGMSVMLFTAAIDDRYGKGIIKSRIGLSEEATMFDDQTDFINVITANHNKQPMACVLVDEAQFLSAEQVDQLAHIVDTLDLPVLCYGIRTDFQGQLFSGSARLLAIADKLFELKTVCSCGRKATMTVRLDANGQAILAGAQVEIGGNERYESKCRRHHQELTNAAKLSTDLS